MGVDLGVNAADEETGYTGDTADVSAGSRSGGQTFDVSVCDLLVDVERKKKGYVYVDAFADELANGLDAFRSGRHLYHEIFATHRFPESPRFLQGPSCVIGEQRGDFEADVAVVPFAFVIYGPQNVCRILDVFHGDLFVEPFRVQGGRILAVDHGFIIGAAYDRLFENGRIGCDAAEAVFDNQTLQLSAGDQTATNVIQPDGLPKI